MMRVLTTKKGWRAFLKNAARGGLSQARHPPFRGMHNGEPATPLVFAACTTERGTERVHMCTCCLVDTARVSLSLCYLRFFVTRHTNGRESDKHCQLQSGQNFRHTSPNDLVSTKLGRVGFMQ